VLLRHIDRRDRARAVRLDFREAIAALLVNGLSARANPDGA